MTSLISSRRICVFYALVNVMTFFIIDASSLCYALNYSFRYNSIYLKLYFCCITIQSYIPNSFPLFVALVMEAKARSWRQPSSTRRRSPTASWSKKRSTMTTLSWHSVRRRWTSFSSFGETRSYSRYVRINLFGVVT